MIAASTHLHYAYVCTALKRGVDVFWDKPMATDYETACAITSCAEKAERKRMVCQPYRATAAVNQLMYSGF